MYELIHIVQAAHRSKNQSETELFQSCSTDILPYMLSVADYRINKKAHMTQKRRIMVTSQQLANIKTQV